MPDMGDMGDMGGLGGDEEEGVSPVVPQVRP